MDKSVSRQAYVLLELGDVIAATDEAFSRGSWFPASEAFVGEKYVEWMSPARRPIDEPEEVVTALQKALAYWMPMVFNDRSAHDAYLLFGYQGEHEPSFWGDEPDFAGLNERLSKLLHGVALALKGPEAPLTAHSWHDLPELAAKVAQQAHWEACPVARGALASSIEQVEALSFSEDRGLVVSEAESMMLVLHELRRLQVLEAQAVEIVARESDAQAEAVTRYAKDLTVSIWRKHFEATAPGWKPLDDLYGLLSQIDNMTVDLVRAVPTADVDAVSVDLWSASDEVVTCTHAPISPSLHARM